MIHMYAVSKPGQLEVNTHLAINELDGTVEWSFL
jgi:hypothetical protein